jgi:pyrimidine operon attenuation protein/uracil phosphoribosyltransferase
MITFAGMSNRVILHSRQVELIVKRLAFQLIENHPQQQETVMVGLQPRGIYLAQRIHQELCDILGDHAYRLGALDVTFYRDDFRRREKPLVPSATNLDFVIEGKRVVLIDDVFYTGRTVRSGMDALMAFGRPAKVELMVLIERRFSSQIPIMPTYIGHSVDTIAGERVTVQWKQTDGTDQVILFTKDGSEHHI